MSEKSANPIPQGKYIPANRYEKIIYTAGMTPRVDGKLMLEGKVSAAYPLEHYCAAVRQATKNALVAAKNMLQEKEEIAKVLTMTVYVNAEDGYKDHSKVADFASDYLCEELGEAGVVSRAAVGVASLPGNAPFEVQLVVVVK